MASFCALALVLAVDAPLALLQIGVGCQGGAGIPGHPLRSAFVYPAIVTTSTYLQNAFDVMIREAMGGAACHLDILLYFHTRYWRCNPLITRHLDGTSAEVRGEKGVRKSAPLGLLW